MAIPKYDAMYRELLEFLSDNAPHRTREIRDSLAASFHVSEAERAVLLPSGRQPVFDNRVHWASFYLKQAGLIENTSRGVYRLTAAGKEALYSHTVPIDNNFLQQFDSFRQFLARSGTPHSAPGSAAPCIAYNGADATPPALSGESPQDILDDAYRAINATLIDDILSEIMKQSPVFFEHLVVNLLKQMGYGSHVQGSGTVTRRTADEGIDGIIREDKLGFNLIYIQAKRWDPSSTVGRPELQKFVGALAGQGAAKGLFITTAQFTKEAAEYADKQHTTKIVLIDGTALAQLMIEYNVGVSVETIYAIKKIDSDFFDDSFC